VCASAAGGLLPLLPRQEYQWAVVAALAGTSLLGLWLLLHPRGARLPSLLRLLLCVLALLNGVLAVLLGLWLLVVQGVLLAHLAAHQAQHQQTVLLMGDPRYTSVPAVRMITNGSAWAPGPVAAGARV
jgi:hypothetical protein